MSISDAKEAVTRWREFVEWISMSWDCIEKYTNDLGCKKYLQSVLDEPNFVAINAVPSTAKNTATQQSPVIPNTCSGLTE